MRERYEAEKRFFDEEDALKEARDLATAVAEAETKFADEQTRRAGLMAPLQTALTAAQGDLDGADADIQAQQDIIDDTNSTAAEVTAAETEKGRLEGERPALVTSRDDADAALADYRTAQVGDDRYMLEGKSFVAFEKLQALQDRVHAVEDRLAELNGQIPDAEMELADAEWQLEMANSRDAQAANDHVREMQEIYDNLVAERDEFSAEFDDKTAQKAEAQGEWDTAEAERDAHAQQNNYQADDYVPADGPPGAPAWVNEEGEAAQEGEGEGT